MIVKHVRTSHSLIITCCAGSAIQLEARRPSLLSVLVAPSGHMELFRSALSTTRLCDVIQTTGRSTLTRWRRCTTPSSPDRFVPDREFTRRPRPTDPCFDKERLTSRFERASATANRAAATIQHLVFFYRRDAEHYRRRRRRPAAAAAAATIAATVDVTWYIMISDTLTSSTEMRRILVRQNSV